MVGSFGGKLTRLTRGSDGWERAEVLKLHGALDNLMMGDDGRLWVAGHPSAVAFSKHAKSASNLGPSEVYALTRGDEGWVVADSWIDQTGAVSASSTASMVGANLTTITPWRRPNSSSANSGASGGVTVTPSTRYM